MTRIRKKLIEVALPLDAINTASAREKSIRHGHPSTLHLWWARRPLAAARAVIFAQMVDDPSGRPDLFPTEEAQEKERQRLFRIIEELVKWENTTNETVLEAAREEIRRSWRRTCADNAEHQRAKELFDPDRLPAFHDPFAGGGALPLEAQRLGLEAYASDLNPVAVLINKAMIEIPPSFAGQAPVNPESRGDPNLFEREWKGAQGLAEDVRYYGKWMREEAEKRIGHLYPRVEITSRMVKERPDLKPYLGRKLTVIAWLWSRTVRSPNPAFANVEVPLASTFMLSTKKGKEAYVEPLIENGDYRFTVKSGRPRDEAATKAGTKLGRGANFRCLLSGTPIEGDYIKGEGKASRIGARLMAVVAEGNRQRVYLAPTAEHEAAAHKAAPAWRPDVEFFQQALGFRIGNYGMTKWSDLFTDRQLVALTTFSDLVSDVAGPIRRDALAAGLRDIGKPSSDSHDPDGEVDATMYADAVRLYLAFAVDRMAMTGNNLVRWNAVGEKAQHCFGRQALPMLWDYAEPNFLAGATGGVDPAVFYSCDPLTWMTQSTSGSSKQEAAATQRSSGHKLVSTDPPYYDNVGYADLSDFFYVWLRRSLRTAFPELFATLAVPKSEELVATPERHGGKEKAESFFLAGMTQAMHRIAEQVHPAFPVTIYYAFKQSENESDSGTASTGWETFLDAVIRAGFSTTGTWPMRTEMATRLRGMASNALASSIVLVCRRRPADTPIASRREFVSALKAELPTALRRLQAGNIAPVDLAQAAIGPGMAIYTRYGAVKESDGSNLSVRTALQLINQVLDETLAEQEGDFDAETRWALAWFEEFGTDEGLYGRAETLCTAKNTSMGGLDKAGIVKSGGGKVRLLDREELDPAWNPQKDSRLTIWEAAQHLIRLHEAEGEEAAAELLAQLGGVGETARELAYRLYSICERKKWAQEALAYNAVVTAWPELSRLAHQEKRAEPLQLDAF